MASLDSTKSAGSVKIHAKSIAHDLGNHADRTIAEKLAARAADCLLPTSRASQEKQ